MSGTVRRAADAFGGEAAVSGWGKAADRRYFIGGSDARIIMGEDEAALIRLWREKRGEASRRTFPATSSSSSGSPLKNLTGVAQCPASDATMHPVASAARALSIAHHD